MKLRLIFVVAFFITYSTSYSQSPADSILNYHSPRKATIYSAILPGAGQAYNKKYWKIPIIYAGFVGLGYLAKTNNDDYKIYKEAYKLRLDGDESTIDDFVDIYSDNDLVTLKNFYRRNRDLSYIGISVLYILNILDATVDAHLFNFNVSDNLSMKIQPEICPGPYSTAMLNINFKF